MDRQQSSSSEHRDDSVGNHEHAPEEWAELMARTIAHLAAQLTMTQIRLRALATELDARGTLDEPAIRKRMGEIAAVETGVYLRENLGEALAEVIDLEALEREIAAFLQP
jgi:hypothetical protein